MSFKKKYQTELSNSVGFFTSPNSIFDLGLKSSEISVFLYLVSGAEKWHPSIGQIVSKTSLSKTTVSGVIKKLLSKNFITKTQDSTTRTAAHYEILPPSQWSNLDTPVYQNITPSGIIQDPLEGQNVATYKKKQKEKKKTASSFLGEQYEREEERIVTKLLEKNGIFNIHSLIQEIVSAHGEAITLESIHKLVANYNSSAPKDALNRINTAYKLGIEQFNLNLSSIVNTTMTEDSIAEIDHAQRLDFINNLADQTKGVT